MRVAARLADELGCRLVRKGQTWIVLEREHLTGQYATRLRATGFRGPIVSCEPIPPLAEQLEALAKKDPHWYVERVALSDACADVPFHVMAISAFSSLRPPKTSDTGDFTAVTASQRR